MTQNLAKYLLIFTISVIYINRALFLCPVENGSNAAEINTFTEFVVQLVTGENNGIDEDGDSHNSCNTAKIIQTAFSQHFSQIVDFQHNFSYQKILFVIPLTENIPQKLVIGEIEQPPQI